jgi:hypothetical protein
MAARKSPISLDPLIASDGAPGRIRWAIVQTGCTIVDEPGEVAGQERLHLCTQGAQRENGA